MPLKQNHDCEKEKKEREVKKKKKKKKQTVRVFLALLERRRHVVVDEDAFVRDLQAIETLDLIDVQH
jgi:hypothetical protein